MGKITQEGVRKRKYREKLGQCPEPVPLLSSSVPPELEIELEKEIKEEKILKPSVSAPLDIDLGIEPEKAQRQQRFTPPKEQEVKAYLKERGITTFQAAQFIDYYESKGWMIGKNKMKDWKAAVRTWERNDVNKGRPENKPISTGAVKEIESWEKDTELDEETQSLLKKVKQKLNISMEG
jgi:hypothetical protein